MELIDEGVWVEGLDDIPAFRNNYKSAAAFPNVVRDMLEAQTKLSPPQVVKMSAKEAQDFAREQGTPLLVASLGALIKTEAVDGSDPVLRLLHDGTHGVEMAQRIRVRDQARCPAAPDEDA